MLAESHDCVTLPADGLKCMDLLSTDSHTIVPRLSAPTPLVAVTTYNPEEELGERGSFGLSMLWRWCTLVYCTQLLLLFLLDPPKYPTLDDVHTVQTAQHAGRRLCAHVLSGRKRQVPSLAAAHVSRVRGCSKYSTHMH